MPRRTNHKQRAVWSGMAKSEQSAEKSCCPCEQKRPLFRPSAQKCGKGRKGRRSSTQPLV
eukprot:6472890-Amphidinium_carterae.3